ncbi:SDH family Clp fold serine proteinase [Leptospira yasudae]|uniref:SDH family Clp fold serine proteinase n=1 Tax=Leptospira yasudae TaxID=2202201 RepID=UPI001314CC98|nr:serine dehydrogenasease [Leptospira yasudae]
MSQEEIKESKSESKKLSLDDLLKLLFIGYDENGTDEAKKQFGSTLSQYLKQVFDGYEKLKNYNVIIHYDPSSITKGDSDSIYESVVTFDKNKPILDILYSRGGSGGTAYLIGKLFRENCEDKIVVAVPRIAKSAATLLCCVADEIHMGSLSELGPIDPQFDDKPALGLKNAIEHLALLVKENPESSSMFAQYLHLSIDPINLGYYERVAESSMQYAERLLNTHKNRLSPDKIKKIAADLVYAYKDHGFVIDKSEASEIFGAKIVKINTDEYKFSNDIYNTLNFIRRMSQYLNYQFYFIGSFDAEPTFRQKN